MSIYEASITNPKKQLEFYKDLSEQLQRENKKIKKQLEDANEKIILLQTSEPMLNYKKTLEETQQKEFTKWLEDESKKIYRDGGLRQNIYKEVLKKYKEIIGGK